MTNRPQSRRRRALSAKVRITGVELITNKIQKYRDATRYKVFLAEKRELAERQKREAQDHERRQQLQTLTMQRRLRALELVEKRELRSLETELLKERRVENQERQDRQPPVEPTRTHTDVFNEAAKKLIDLIEEFKRVAEGGDDEEAASGDTTDQVAPEAEITIQRRDRSQDLERPAKSKHLDSEDDGPSDDPTPRRRRDRDFDRGR